MSEVNKKNGTGRSKDAKELVCGISEINKKNGTDRSKDAKELFAG